MVIVSFIKASPDNPELSVRISRHPGFRVWHRWSKQINLIQDRWWCFYFLLSAIMTGSYNNFFRVFDCKSKKDVTLEASRENSRPRALLKPKKVAQRLAVVFASVKTRPSFEADGTQGPGCCCCIDLVVSNGRGAQFASEKLQLQRNSIFFGFRGFYLWEEKEMYAIR